MKLKNAQLNDFTVQGINKLIKQDIPIELAWSLKKIVRLLEPILKSKEELKMKLIDEFAKKDENGKYIPQEDKDGKPIPNTTQLKDEEGFNKKFKELNDMETEIEIKKFKLEQFKGINISTQELMAIDFLFEE